MVKNAAYIVYNVVNILLLEVLGIIIVCFYVFLLRDQRLIFDPHEGKIIMGIMVCVQIIKLAILCLLFIKQYGWRIVWRDTPISFSNYHYYNVVSFVFESVIVALNNHGRGTYLIRASVEEQAIVVIFVGTILLSMLNAPAYFLYHLIVKTVVKDVG